MVGRNMKQVKRRRWHAFSVVAVFLGWLVTTQIAFAQSEKPTLKSQKPGTFRLNVTEGRLSLEANQAPLAKIFEEIAKQAKITVDSDIGPEEKVTIQLDHVALEDAVKQLAKNVTIFYAEDPKRKTPRIARLVVLPEGNEKAPQFERSKGLSSKPAKTNEPAPQPEPFKFEFDPAKFVEKQKPR
jgi:hypothetical protein